MGSINESHKDYWITAQTQVSQYRVQHLKKSDKEFLAYCKDMFNVALSLSIQKKLKLIDIETAILQREKINREVYIKLP